MQYENAFVLGEHRQRPPDRIRRPSLLHIIFNSNLLDAFHAADGKAMITGSRNCSYHCFIFILLIWCIFSCDIISSKIHIRIISVAIVFIFSNIWGPILSSCIIWIIAVQCRIIHILEILFSISIWAANASRNTEFKCCFLGHLQTSVA